MEEPETESLASSSDQRPRSTLNVVAEVAGSETILWLFRLWRRRKSVAQTERRHSFYRLHRFLNCFYTSSADSGMVSWLLEWGFWIVTVAGPPMVAIAEFCDPSSQTIPDSWVAPASWIYENRLVAVIVVIVCQAVFGVSWLFVHRMNALSGTECQEIIDTIVAQHFKEMDLDNHVYRATVFQIRGFHRLFGRWLGIAARSGENYARSNTVFSISDMKKGRNTGVCGECVRQGGNTLTVELPDPDDSAYKDKGFINDREFIKVNVKSVVFHATGVFRKGRLWGVLVLDTTDRSKMPGPNARRREQEAVGNYSLAIRALLD